MILYQFWLEIQMIAFFNEKFYKKIIWNINGFKDY